MACSNLPRHSWFGGGQSENINLIISLSLEGLLACVQQQRHSGWSLEDCNHKGMGVSIPSLIVLRPCHQQWLMRMEILIFKCQGRLMVPASLVMEDNWAVSSLLREGCSLYPPPFVIYFPLSLSLSLPLSLPPPLSLSISLSLSHSFSQSLLLP